MKIFRLIVLLGVVVMLSSFIQKPLNFYEGTQPKMSIKDYFNGPIKAWGIVQDWRGQVVSRFDVSMIGKWEGDVGTLTEHFTYYDGKKQERIWTIKKLSDGSYEGTASDIIDKAVGLTEGSAARWSYAMDLPIEGTTYRIHFDDWMWLMNDGVLINRSYLKKFGITVSELTIVMKKDAP